MNEILKRGIVMRRNKKASLELSIRAIVIVILAMTLLGLGLGFVRNMFKDIGGITTDVSEQIRQQILDDLITSDKKISFPKTQIIMDKGGSEILTVGIRNKQDSSLNYRIEFNTISGPEGDLSGSSLDEWFQYSTAEASLVAADSTVRNIRLNIPSRGTSSGSYFLTFDVINVDSSLGQPDYIYGQKDFFIVVRG
ncbi:hypothetical protein ISS07_05425 [Candidatus Woesearchaeota archaeon]|nr:hypothetical protein [Candidatus Woesearchaeota archaeon]